MKNYWPLWIYAFTVSFLCLISCKKNEIPNRFYFGGLISTDSNGKVFMQTDTVDWKFDVDSWDQQEEDLFSIRYVDAMQHTTAGLLLYPNPSKGVFSIQFDRISVNQRFMIRLVNRNFAILYKNDSIINQKNGSYIMFDFTKYYNGDTMRIYYELLDSTNLRHIGHGNILIN